MIPLFPLIIMAAVVLTVCLAAAAAAAWCMRGRPVLPPYERTHQ